MNGVITTCCGSFGRFGNALFQYCVARAYAESIGAELRTGDWIGRRLFEGVNEPLMEGLKFPALKDEILDGSTNVQLHGYFQSPEHLKLLSRSKIKEWLKPKREWIKVGCPLAIHKRRGDFISSGCYALVSDASYTKAILKFGFDPEMAAVFSDDRPAGNQYDDFFQLMFSDVLFRANSSFSWWAAALSDGQVFSPVVEDKTGWIDCEFVKGNESRLMYLFGEMKIGD